MDKILVGRLMMLTSLIILTTVALTRPESRGLATAILLIPAAFFVIGTLVWAIPAALESGGRRWAQRLIDVAEHGRFVWIPELLMVANAAFVTVLFFDGLTPVTITIFAAAVGLAIVAFLFEAAEMVKAPSDKVGDEEGGQETGLY